MKQYCQKLSSMLSLIIYGVLASLLLLTFSQKASADTMQGEGYQLNLKQVQEADPTSTPAPTHAITPTTSPIPTPPPISSYGESELHFSDDFVQFGPLSPTTPVVRRVTIMVKGEAFPFSLYQQLNHNLMNDPGDEIPATSCDNGSCSGTQAAPWESTLTFGLGVRCDNITGQFCPDDFVDTNVFRPLASQPQVVASGTLNGEAQISLTYKLIVPGTQPQGAYEASPTYILVPGI